MTDTKIEELTRISIHALLAESDNSSVNTADQEARFLSTLSLRRATPRGDSCYLDNIISIHALLAESDPSFYFLWRRFRYFYPRSPCGERHQRHWLDSTHRRISIHALLAESDIISPHSTPDNGNFYPRSPCGERQASSERINRNIAFLSTLSLRRATTQTHQGGTHHENFYPRSPCGERHRFRSWLIPCNRNFYPRSPCGERLCILHHLQRLLYISIHALLAESDE